MTETPTTDSDTEKSDDYEQKRAELIERTKERKQSLTEEQDAILDDIQQEHGGELIETTCRITPNHTVGVSVDLNGEFIDRMGEIEDLNERIESGDTMASGPVRSWTKPVSCLPTRWTILNGPRTCFIKSTGRTNLRHWVNCSAILPMRSRKSGNGSRGR